MRWYGGLNSPRQFPGEWLVRSHAGGNLQFRSQHPAIKFGQLLRHGTLNSHRPLVLLISKIFWLLIIKYASTSTLYKRFRFTTLGRSERVGRVDRDDERGTGPPGGARMQDLCT